MRRRSFLALALPLALLAGASPPQGRSGAAAGNDAPTYGLDAPMLEVDRFSDAAGTLLRRSIDPHLPGPNEPIDLDAAPFSLSVEAPDGRLRICYNLDLRPASPGRYYVFYDERGNYLLTQFPVVDVAPGDPGYTDIWDIWKVIVPAGFREDNGVRDRATIERLLADPASGYSAVRTRVLLNGPIVPEGSRARMKADRRGGDASIRYAWYRGRRAPYLYFEGSLRAEGEIAPVAIMTLTRSSDRSGLRVQMMRSETGASPPARVSVVPGASGYSPLWQVNAPAGGTL